MAGAIVYRSSYGSTKQYAEWIAEETGFKLFNQETDEVPWAEFDTVVIGCPALAMKPFLAKWVTETWNQLEGKRVVLYTASGTNPATPALRKGFESAFPPEIAGKIDYYPLHGRMIWKNLKPMHKLIMRIGQLIEKDKARKKEMVRDVDGVSRESISPIVQSLAAAT